jgi:hypothetical protein
MGRVSNVTMIASIRCTGGGETELKTPSQVPDMGFIEGSMLGVACKPPGWNPATTSESAAS